MLTTDPDYRPHQGSPSQSTWDILNAFRGRRPGGRWPESFPGTREAWKLKTFGIRFPVPLEREPDAPSTGSRRTRTASVFRQRGLTTKRGRSSKMRRERRCADLLDPPWSPPSRGRGGIFIPTRQPADARDREKICPLMKHREKGFRHSKHRGIRRPIASEPRCFDPAGAMQPPSPDRHATQAGRGLRPSRPSAATGPFTAGPDTNATRRHLVPVDRQYPCPSVTSGGTCGYESSAVTACLGMQWAFMRAAPERWLTATYRSCNFGDHHDL